MGKTASDLLPDIWKSLNSTEMDTDPQLIALKEQMQLGTARYEDFMASGQTQLATIGGDVFTPQSLSPDALGWRTVDGFPKSLDQSILSRTGLLFGMAVAGESPENIAELYDDNSNVYDTINDGRGQVLGTTTNPTAMGLSTGADILNTLFSAAQNFNQQEIGCYQITVQYYGTANNPENMRVIIVAGTHPDQSGNYTVINSAYAKKIILGLREEDN